MTRLSFVCIALLVAASSAAQQQTLEVTPLSASRDLIQLTPSTRTKAVPVLVDRTDVFSTIVTAASRTLTVTLTGPGGTKYTIGQPGPVSFQSAVVPIDADGTRGAAYVATFEDPNPGMWTLAVTENAQLTAPLNVVALETFNNSTQVVLAGGGTLPRGKPARFALVVFDGTRRLTGLTIAAQLVDLDDAATPPVPLTFRDDGSDGDQTAGDGIYGVFATPSEPGTFGIAADATGTASTGVFRRSAAGTFRVVRRYAEIIDFDDRGVDDDFDGLFDRIRISPAANLNKAGNYAVSVRLRGSNGQEIQSSVEQQFSIGTAAPDIDFRASDIIRDLGVPGPYAVAEVRYSRIESGEPVPSDIRYNLGFTDDYKLGQLQHPRLRLAGSGTATGVDAAKRGYFTELRIDLGVLADFAGDYDYSVTLEDRNGTELGFITGSARLAAGGNKLRLVFPGEPIGRNRVDGPYFVTNLILFGEGHSLVVRNAFTTQAFAATQFGRFGSKSRSVRH